MPEIVGTFNTLYSNVPPLDAHIGILRHLTNPTVAQDLLHHKFGFTEKSGRIESTKFCAHISQSLQFHEESRRSTIRIRPVLQYYSYLNLAVAAILAYRPTNYQQYRQHGVEDRSHKLSKLTLSSEVVKVKRGAVPLFHSILSDDDLYGRKLRLGHLAAGIHMLSHELRTLFGKEVQKIHVADTIVERAGNFHSQVSFKSAIAGNQRPITHDRLEKAMPLLNSDYSRQKGSRNPLIYNSIKHWTTAVAALNTHRNNCLKLINYGGHSIIRGTISIDCHYSWHGVSRVKLLPTLTSLLLFSFSLASIVRYRPALLNSALMSKYQILIETFVQESPGLYFPALRNLLNREEVYLCESDFL